MITKFKNYLITESPDTIYDEEGHGHYYQSDEAKPFFVEVNSDHTKVEKIFVGKRGSCHGDMRQNNISKTKAYPGRVFLDSKLMAFWVYPNEKLFISIIEKLEDKLDIEMFDNGWRIEVIKTNNGIKRTEFEPQVGDYYFSNGRSSGDKTLIPIEEYAGSENVSKEDQIMHLMNWKEKDEAIKAGKFHFGSFGSFKTGWDQPHNIKYRQAIYQENKNNNDN